MKSVTDLIIVAKDFVSKYNIWAKINHNIVKFQRTCTTVAEDFVSKN